MKSNTHTSENQIGFLRMENSGDPDIPIWNEKECVCTVWNTSNTEANAARIVKCVNNHDRLLEALQSVLNTFEDMVSCPEIEGMKFAIGMAIKEATE